MVYFYFIIIQSAFQRFLAESFVKMNLIPCIFFIYIRPTNMISSLDSIVQLFSIRNQYGSVYAAQKLDLLKKINPETFRVKSVFQNYAETLSFLIAYPDNKTVFQIAKKKLADLTLFCNQNESIKRKLFNSGLVGSKLCASFSFEIIKWLNKYFPDKVSLSMIEANDATIQSILSAVLPKVESEIMQDANENWS